MHEILVSCPSSYETELAEMKNKENYWFRFINMSSTLNYLSDVFMRGIPRNEIVCPAAHLVYYEARYLIIEESFHIVFFRKCGRK